MRVIQYLPNSIVDGPGIRQVFYLAGCLHRCPGCHNPQSWNFEQGEIWTANEVETTIIKSSYPVTFSGGDPLYQSEELASICKYIHGTTNIWVYTGFTWEQIMENPGMKKVMPWIDCLVDGPFKQELKDERCLFRGSSNQRIIDAKESFRQGKIVLWRDGNYGEYL